MMRIETMEIASSRAYIEFVAAVKLRKAVCCESIKSIDVFDQFINVPLLNRGTAYILLPFFFGKEACCHWN
ncbi:MAG: hypothetical protein HF982_13950 [Desulfobacteraceae bacterium]|nr:hypothetical protein [Desulfobacteraceae bacterium]MBC2720661.1 hypothetical protein [Desulfobacteraceae bacterium]